MNLKIIIIMLILLFSINIISGQITDEGSFSEYSFETHDTATHGHISKLIESPFRLKCFNSENYQDGIQYLYIDIPDADFLGTYKSTYDSYYENIYLYEPDIVAYGKIGYYKLPNNDYRLWLWFDLTTWSYTGSGEHTFTIVGHTKEIYKTHTFYSNYHSHDDIYSCCFYNQGNNYLMSGMYHIDTIYNFKNTFYTQSIGNLKEVFYDKTILGYTGSSKIKITDSNNTVLFNETSFNTNNINVSYYTEYIPFKLECINYEEKDFLNYLYFTPPDITDCRIEVDNIDIGDSINVSYFNIDDLRENPFKYGDSGYSTYDLNLQILIDRGYYDELIYQDMIIDEEDNIFYYSSEDLTAGIYYAQINKNLGSLNDYAVRKTFKISQPANFSIIVNPENNYIGDNINIIYKALNLSTISIYDNNNNKIHNWLNIQGDNQNIYKIPIDENYDNAYPNWYIYLNDSGNLSNNLRFNFTVNWKVYVEIEPIPEPTEPYYNETIEENIEEIREGLNPLKELIFGFSTIFVDNPDYNKDNIVDVNEISTWLNSLISIALIIFLYILYKVYKRK